MQETRLEEPAPPSALDELGRDDSSRKRFLKMAGGTAVAAGLSAALAACGTENTKKATPKGSAQGPLAQYGPGDVGVLNYALTLEFVETAFYAAALRSGTLAGATLAMAHRFAAQEAEHAGAISAMVRRLGGTPVKPQKATFPVATRQTTLSTASTLENIGAGALLGQIDRVQAKEVLALLLSMHTVEGRHAAAIARALGHSPTPDGAFASPISVEDAQGQIQTYLAG
jgi:hypothetical protein